MGRSDGITEVYHYWYILQELRMPVVNRLTPRISGKLRSVAEQFVRLHALVSVFHDLGKFDKQHFPDGFLASHAQ